MGLLTAASYAAWLVLGLPAGVITQRLPLRRLQLATDLLRALAVASVPLAWWLDALTLAHLLVVALVVGCASVLFDVANSTFLPSVVPREQLQSRNSLMSGTFAATQLSGPPVGGGAVALVGAAPALLLDAVSYLVSAVLLRRLPEAQAPPVARRADADDDPRGLALRDPSPGHGALHVGRHRHQLRVRRPDGALRGLPGPRPRRVTGPGRRAAGRRGGRVAGRCGLRAPVGTPVRLGPRAAWAADSSRSSAPSSSRSAGPWSGRRCSRSATSSSRSAWCC